MSKYYTLGIIFLIISLNIPEIRGDMQAKVMIARPIVEQRLQAAKDTYQPVILALMKNAVARTTFTSNGISIKPIDIDTSDTFSLLHKPSMTAEQFDAVLREYNSPATGIGSFVTSYAAEKNIDNAYVLYMFIHESTAGTNKKWAAQNTKNPGNIICAGYSTCVGRFRKYNSWEDGFEDLIDLLVYYRDKLGDKDTDAAINRWAPPIENNTSEYAESLKEHVREWRNVNKGQFVATTQETGAFIQAVAAPTFILPADKEIKSSSLSLGGCLSNTVPYALEPSLGLQEFSIPAGKSWSFNEQWVIVNKDSHYCSGVVYGGICDMASQYQMVAKQLGLERVYGRHPGGLYNITYDDTVVIWSDGKRGGQDLEIINNTSKMAVFRAQIQNGVFTVSGWLE